MASNSRSKIIRLSILLVILAGATGLAVRKYFIPAPLLNGVRAGGVSLHVDIPAPTFQQFDSRWGAQQLGHGRGTLETEGCTVCCLAMALQSKGIAMDPAALNRKIESSHGFTDSGLVVWSSVKVITDGRFDMVVPDSPTHEQIDEQLSHGNPVLAKVFFDNRLPHWVLLTGKHDLNYVIRDPLGNADTENLEKYPKGIYSIRYLKALE